MKYSKKEYIEERKSCLPSKKNKKCVFVHIPAMENVT